MLFTPKTKKQKPSENIISIRRIFQKLTAQEIIYTHSQITMVGVPKIIYPLQKQQRKKKKNSKSNHNQVLKFLTQLSPTKQFITAFKSIGHTQ